MIKNELKEYDRGRLYNEFKMEFGEEKIDSIIASCGGEGKDCVISKMRELLRKKRILDNKFTDKTTDVASKTLDEYSKKKVLLNKQDLKKPIKKKGLENNDSRIDTTRKI